MNFYQELDRKLHRLRMLCLMGALAILAVHLILTVEFYPAPGSYVDFALFRLQVLVLPLLLWPIRIMLFVLALISASWYADFLEREVLPIVRARGRKIPVFFTFLFFFAAKSTEELRDELIKRSADQYDRHLEDLCAAYGVESGRRERIWSAWLCLKSESGRMNYLMTLERRLAREKLATEMPKTAPAPALLPQLKTPSKTERQLQIEWLERETLNCKDIESRRLRESAMAESDEKEKLRLLGEARSVHRRVETEKHKSPSLAHSRIAHAKR